jgi:hypothetical protein
LRHEAVDAPRCACAVAVPGVQQLFVAAVQGNGVSAATPNNDMK